MIGRQSSLVGLKSEVSKREVRGLEGGCLIVGKSLKVLAHGYLIALGMRVIVRGVFNRSSESGISSFFILIVAIELLRGRSSHEGLEGVQTLEISREIIFI